MLMCSHSFRGLRLEYLPTYSPDFNPIELAFSAFKAYIRRHYKHFSRSSADGADSFDEAEVYIMLNEALYSISAEDAHGFFHHCLHFQRDQSLLYKLPGIPFMEGNLAIKGKSLVTVTVTSVCRPVDQVSSTMSSTRCQLDVSGIRCQARYQVSIGNQ